MGNKQKSPVPYPPNVHLIVTSLGSLSAQPKAIRLSVFSVSSCSPLNLNPAVQRPQIARIPQMGNHFIAVGSACHSHLLGERTFFPNVFLICVICEIRGSNCSF